MKIKVITSYKPGTWESFARRGIHTMAEQFSPEVDIFLYCEEKQPNDVQTLIVSRIAMETENISSFELVHPDGNELVLRSRRAHSGSFRR